MYFFVQLPNLFKSSLANSTLQVLFFRNILKLFLHCLLDPIVTVELFDAKVICIP